jgi:hypothetical protein
VTDLETAANPRLVVRVEGSRDGAWAREVPGVTVSQVYGSAVRLVLADSVDSQTVLAAAMRAGRVSQFDFERRRLSEVFREAVA